MATNSANVDVAITGALYVGAVGLAIPTSASSAIPAAAADLGYFNDDGVTETRDRSTDTIKAWQNADEVREVVTDASLTYKGTLIETKLETVQLYYGTKVDPTTGKIVIVPAKTGGRQSFILDVIDGTSLIRTFIDQGEVTDVEDQQYANGQAIAYGFTIKAYPSSRTPDTDGTPGSAVKWFSQLKTSS